MKDPNKSLRSLTESVNKLYEQLPPAGAGGFGQTDPSIPQRISGGIPSREPKPSQSPYVGISAMYGYPYFPSKWNVNSKWSDIYRNWVRDGMNGDMPWPPQVVDEDGNPVNFASHDPLDMGENYPEIDPLSGFMWWNSIIHWFFDGATNQGPGTSIFGELWRESGSPPPPEEYNVWGILAQGAQGHMLVSLLTSQGVIEGGAWPDDFEQKFYDWFHAMGPFFKQIIGPNWPPDNT